MTNENKLSFPTPLMASLTRTTRTRRSWLSKLALALAQPVAWPPIQLGLRWRCVHDLERSNKWEVMRIRFWRLKAVCLRNTEASVEERPEVVASSERSSSSVIGVFQPWQVAANATNTGKLCSGTHGRLQLRHTFSVSIQVEQKT